MIFKWYAEDFGSSDSEVQKPVARKILFMTDLLCRNNNSHHVLLPPIQGPCMDEGQGKQY